MKKNGFTLVELLAVIVILAIILVIAVPKISDTINNAKKGSMASSVKMIAAAAEREKMVQETLGSDFKDKAENGSIDCASVNNKVWSNIDSTQFSACSVTFNGDNATVTLTGAAAGKFPSWTCTGTRSDITSGECK